MNQSIEARERRAADEQAESLHFVSRGAIRILCAIADSMFPPDHVAEAQRRAPLSWRSDDERDPLPPAVLPAPRHDHVARYFDNWLAENSWPVRTFIRLFWLIFELSPLFFVFRLRRFSSLDPDGRIDYLNAWGDHWFYWCRMASTLLKSQVAMAYFADPVVRSKFRVPPSPLAGREFLKWRGRDE
ncbi:MAG: hypothetical protein KC609_17700 [Myxococcales bacterium]|nr:hypothetical protein [Myxococcales bacterium]